MAARPIGVLSSSFVTCVSRKRVSSMAVPFQRNLALLWTTKGGIANLESTCFRQLATGAAQSRTSESDASGDIQSKRSSRPARPRKAVMEVTEAAAQRIKELMQQKDPKPHGIRLGVRTRG
jgi:hypothetical protein